MGGAGATNVEWMACLGGSALVAPIDGVLMPVGTPTHATRIAPAGRRVEPASGCTFTALAVDDVAANRKLVRLFLAKVGGDVVVAGDGVEALEMMRSRDFDVVLCDIQMPKMNGLDCVRHLRSWEVEEGLAPAGRMRVCAFTALASVADAQRCLDVGMDGVLTKPLTRLKLNAMLSSLGVQFDATRKRGGSGSKTTTNRPRRLTPVMMQLQQ